MNKTDGIVHFNVDTLHIPHISQFKEKHANKNVHTRI